MWPAVPTTTCFMPLLQGGEASGEGGDVRRQGGAWPRRGGGGGGGGGGGAGRQAGAAVQQQAIVEQPAEHRRAAAAEGLIQALRGQIGGTARDGRGGQPPGGERASAHLGARLYDLRAEHPARVRAGPEQDASGPATNRRARLGQHPEGRGGP